LKDDEAFYVPRVYDEFSNTRVLTTELVPGNFRHGLVYFCFLACAPLILVGFFIVSTPNGEINWFKKRSKNVESYGAQ